jgi:hypothetical protein
MIGQRLLLTIVMDINMLAIENNRYNSKTKNFISVVAGM